jgi:predicted small metal-binding protein
MRAILCGCNRRLQADNYEGLVEEVLEHLLQGHSKISLGESQVRVVREIVAARSYRLERTEYE